MFAVYFRCMGGSHDRKFRIFCASLTNQMITVTLLDKRQGIPKPLPDERNTLIICSV